MEKEPITLSHRAKKLLSRAFSAGVEPEQIKFEVQKVIKNAETEGTTIVTRKDLRELKQKTVSRISAQKDLIKN